MTDFDPPHLQLHHRFLAENGNIFIFESDIPLTGKSKVLAAVSLCLRK